jgi:hypothetical protein
MPALDSRRFNNCCFSEGDCSLPHWNWDSLRVAVQRVIDEGGIGRPATLRLTLHTRGTEADAVQYLQGAEVAAASWFGGQPNSTYSVGGSGAPTVSALKWKSGQSAILSVSVGADGPVGGNVMLMGTHGTVYHEIADSKGGLN